jgi:DNA-binding LacI/PurR family transcriptional regulator
VRQDFDEMGRRGLHLLLDTMHDAHRPPPHHEVAPELIVRASTAAPR